MNRVIDAASRELSDNFSTRSRTFSTIIWPWAVAKPDWKVRTACAITVDKKYMLQPMARGTGKGCHSMGK